MQSLCTTQLGEKKGRGQGLPCRALSKGGWKSENDLAAKLHCARTVVARDRSEVPVVGAGIDALEVHMVEGIEGLESEFDSRSLAGGKGNCLGQGQIPVEDSWSHG